MLYAGSAGAKLAFTFPGQGSFNGEVLGELYVSGHREKFVRADAIARNILGHPFMLLVESRSAEERDATLRACPELDQVGIYLANYLIASELIAGGITPDVLSGHSFGELAALAVAGVFDFETGLRIVCQRSAALRLFASGRGVMAAVSCSADRMAEILHGLGTTGVEIAVINHANQTVISGSATELDQVGTSIARQGIGLTVLKSRYPFHSSLLRPVINPFRLMLCSYTFRDPSFPVYLCTERCLYSSSMNLADVLAQQLGKQLNFRAILDELYEQGCCRFVECGAGNIVTNIVLAARKEGIVARATAHHAGVFQKNRAALTEELGRTRYSPPDVSQTRPLDEVPSSTLAGVEDPRIEVEPVEAEPIAIVSLGCVLPRAHDAEQYWKNILSGITGIADVTREDPSAANDFLVRSSEPEPKIVPDKTYALLTGTAGIISYNARLLSASYSESEFNNLTRAEKLLALAMAQALAGLRDKVAAVPDDRIECVLGSTADGSGDYDNALFRSNIEEILEKIEPDSDCRTAFLACLRRAWEEPPQNNPRATQYQSCESVIRASVGRPIRSYVIDAACSSSLYAISLGVTALQQHSKDVMLVGGVFSPGPANSPLFAQFRGLTPTASRPLDVSADGVIFGEGAGILVLKRLSDAMSAGDRVWGVIRAVGVSSDGRSPAINVPQSRGQSIAIRRAYEASHIDSNSIQYIEAHATATPVGDAVEFEALSQVIGRDPSLSPIELGSVKALIGHTGWAAGVASVIKLCKALESRTFPPQFNYNAPNPAIALAGSRFRISTAASPWPLNIRSFPRRAAINGFGFGGTNAHLILEEFDPAYHRKVCANVARKFQEPVKLAVIGCAALFPEEKGLESPHPTPQRSFPRSALRLPKGKRLLPDVTDHMDAGQFLAALAAERVFEAVGDRWKELRESTGVVLGLESKTERGIQANQRIFLDRLKRRILEDREPDHLPPGARAGMVENLCAAVRSRVIPSGPYTLPGLMPNVSAGRVANLFDLNGPNVVIDMGSNSMFRSVMVARDFLVHGDCKAVLAGGLNAVRMRREDAEAVCLTLLTTETTARELGLPVSCFLSVKEARPETAPGACGPSQYRGAEGTIEILDAISAVRERKGQAVVSGTNSGSTLSLVLHSTLPSEAALEPAPQPARVGGAYAYIRNTPVYHYTPVETAVPLPAVAPPRGRRKILFLIDQPAPWRELEQSGALNQFDYRVLCVQPGPLANSISVDWAREAAMADAFSALRGVFDTIVPVKFLRNDQPESLLTTSDDVVGLTSLLFAVCRQLYDGFQSGKIALGSLCLGAFTRGRLNPFTGLLAGFVKSLARELPAAACRSLNIGDTSFGNAMQLLESELSHSGQAVEVCYREGKRFEIQLARLENVARGHTPLLDAGSVVLATGGGRGVTAVLAEELLTRFGCTVVAVGRTDPSTAPAEILNMDSARLAAFEPEFYRRELARGGRKIVELRDQFRSYQAAHEVHETVKRLSALPGRFEYISADMTNGQAAPATVESVFQKYGRVDLVLHGAGIQVSKVLTKKTVGEFGSVVRTKIASLRHIYQSCEKRRGGRPVHYHLLSSAFSYMGNDGQPDYGAANEALNRVADVMGTAGGPSWCSVGWLGWAGIGMTRGSESAALGASRGLRGLTKREGQEIFARFLIGEPVAAVDVLMADGELKFYKVATTAEPYQPPTPRLPVRKDRLTVERTVGLDCAPYILNHRVDGIPTLPGAFLIMIVAEAALELRPNLKVTAYEDVAFRRFLKLRGDTPLKLRLEAAVVNEDEQGALIRVQVISDFTHKNGIVLQKDVVYFEMTVRMALSIAGAEKGDRFSPVEGRVLYDPYVAGDSPVQLNGPFRTLQNIIVGERVRTAEYHPEEEILEASANRTFLANLLVMDSLWRFGTIDSSADDTLPVYIPKAGKVMKLHYDVTDPANATKLLGKLYMAGYNPKHDNEDLVIGPIEARDAQGSILLSVEGGVCRKFGEVRNGRH